MKVVFHEAIQEPIMAYTFKDIKGTEITGTNTMFEKMHIEHSDEGDTCTVTFTQKMFLQGGEYLLVIRQVEVGGCHKVRDMAEGTRIDQHRAEQGLLGDEAEGNLTLQGNLPAVPAPGEGLLSVHDRQPAQLQTSTWILPATSVYSLTSRSYCP